MSRLTDEIMREYKLKQAYKTKERQKCKETDCKACKWWKICENREEEQI